MKKRIIIIFSVLIVLTGLYFAVEKLGNNKNENPPDYSEPETINIFKTEKQARSSLAMAQLSQLMAYLGDECDVDWNDASLKCTIYKFQNSIRADINRHMYQFLAFKTAKVRDAFLEKHKELIKDYLMI